jgi:hypothetical protein
MSASDGRRSVGGILGVGLLALGAMSWLLWHLVSSSTVGPTVVPAATALPIPPDPGADTARSSEATSAVPDRAPADGAAAAGSSTVDRWDRLRRYRDEVGLGLLTDAELASLVQACANIERDFASRKQAYLEKGGLPTTLEYLDLTLSVEGGLAKANALLEGSYVLLPRDQTPPGRLLDGYHSVQGPGGERNGVRFATWILIDLERHGRFARVHDEWVQKRGETK